jgi:Transposase and inactivated derivatives
LLSLDIRSIKRLFTLLEATEAQIKDLNKELMNYLENNGDAKILTTMKGIGYYSALAIIAVIGDINRFRDSEALCSHLGIVPSTHQSANTTRHGSITGICQYKTAVNTVCLGLHVTKCKNSSLTQFYNRLAKKEGKNKAIVATTRKMVKAIYWMLKDKEPC